MPANADHSPPPVEAVGGHNALHPASVLTDAELVEHADRIVSEMCSGDRWRMSIPVHRHDSDMVLGELTRRYSTLRTAVAEYVEACDAVTAAMAVRSRQDAPSLLRQLVEANTRHRAALATLRRLAGDTQ